MKELIPFEHAKMLKELEFDVPCLFMYDGGFDGKKFTLDMIDVENVDFNNQLDKDDLYYNWATHQISAPFYQQVEEWLWEKHRIYMDAESSNHINFCVVVSKVDSGIIFETMINDSPITAHREAILKAIEHIHKHNIC